MDLQMAIYKQLDQRDRDGVDNEERARELAETIIKLIKHSKQNGMVDWGIVWGILGAILF